MKSINIMQILRRTKAWIDFQYAKLLSTIIIIIAFYSYPLISLHCSMVHLPSGKVYNVNVSQNTIVESIKMKMAWATNHSLRSTMCSLKIYCTMKGANFWLYYFFDIFFCFVADIGHVAESSASAHIYCFLMNLWRSNEYKYNAEKVLVCDYKAFWRQWKLLWHIDGVLTFKWKIKKNISFPELVDYLWGQSFGKMNWALSNHLKGKRFAESNYLNGFDWFFIGN